MWKIWRLNGVSVGKKFNYSPDSNGWDLTVQKNKQIKLLNLSFMKRRLIVKFEQNFDEINI